MKRTSLFLIAFFAFGMFVCSCSSTKTVQTSEEGEQIAKDEILFTEKKVAASSEGKPTEYHYILKIK